MNRLRISTRKAGQAFVLCLAALSCAGAEKTLSASGSRAAGEGSADPEIYIYTRPRLQYCHRRCGDLHYNLQMENLLHLDGLIEWRYTPIFGGDKITFCRIVPPRSSEIHRRISPYLGASDRGYFNSGYVRTIIIDKTAGERIFVDWHGGYYFFGKGTTWRMAPDRERAYHAILDAAIEEGYCE